MKRSTLTIPIDSAILMSLKNASIVGAFINSLPPWGPDLHGTSVELFFENGESCSIDGSIMNIGPKTEIFSLCMGTARKLEDWRKDVLEGNHKPIIKSIDLNELWSRQGLVSLLAGSREVRLYKRVIKGNGLVVEDRSKFEAIQLHVPGVYDQSLLFYTSEECPGDVVIASRDGAAEQNDLVEWGLALQLMKIN